ncbi:MAG TPA: type I glyceraldehyde-3-phosphate dehydrogenase [Candidatus Polarisedimenticolia bacterium]|nr:type I glyceraldehyde-3-phosphate dehydrogenase [Candidatus Polarisedimenticolia bacterium]
MTVRIGINGFGRIGRTIFRIVSERRDMEVVGINDLFPPRDLAYLLRYDTVMGIFEQEIGWEEGALRVAGRRVPLSSERDPGRLPWAALGAEIVVEATGVLRNRASLEPHLKAGAKKVILTVPPKDEVDAIVVLGVNDDVLTPECRIVSNASCTTNCLAPVAKVLEESFGIERGFMTTVHAYTNDQRLADVAHKDFRRARAAARNMIPTTTGAARAVGKVLPQLKGRLDGLAVRVPVPDGSVVDLVVQLKREATVQEVNGAMQKAAEGPLKRVLEYCAEPIVSSDIIGNSHSSIFDALSTQRIGPREMRLLAWYDNEWGYSHRVVDLAARLAGTIA